MNPRFQHDDDLLRRQDGRYFATLEVLDHALMTLHTQLRSAGTAQRHHRTGVLNDLHRRVRGMGLLLNAALGDPVRHADHSSGDKAWVALNRKAPGPEPRLPRE